MKQLVFKDSGAYYQKTFELMFTWHTAGLDSVPRNISVVSLALLSSIFYDRYMPMDLKEALLNQ